MDCRRSLNIKDQYEKRKKEKNGFFLYLRVPRKAVPFGRTKGRRRRRRNG